MYDIHGAVHDAFMMLPAYTRISEGEVQEPGLGVSNGSHRALSDPLSEQSERFERPCEATSAEGTARWASRGKPVPSRFLLSSCSKGSRGSPQRCAIGECPRASTLIRGHRHDYNRWQELGNTGWSYDDVLPYFKKAEDQERGASAYHGVGGPLHVMDLHHVSPRSLAFVEAGVELGWPRNDDCNGACQEGFGIHQVTQRAGKRESTADCYLRPALHRPNLTVMTEALVARVLFEGSQAVGVAYLKDGAEQQIRAHHEVILSGGTINSPQLLMLSGIGPAEHLRTFHMPVVVDLPGVGYHLQDHPCIYISYKIDQPGSLYTRGEGNAYIKSRPELPEPDRQMLFTPSLLSGEQGYTWNAVLATPHSHGHLELRSTDPTQYPAIFANYLEKQNDLQGLVESVKLARRLASTKAFAPFGGVEVEPGPQVQSDQEIVAFIRQRQSTMFHPVGTCKMGRDKMAVVDEELRVHGVQGVRVIDAPNRALVLGIRACCAWA